MTEELQAGDSVQLKVGLDQPTMIIESILHNDNSTCTCIYYDWENRAYVKVALHKIVLKKVASES